MTVHPELPQALDSEAATLGSVLRNRDAIASVADWLLPGMFYLHRHGAIYAAMLDCFHQRVPPDVRTVANALRQSGQLDAVGGTSYLSDLTDACPTSYHIEYYARAVEDAARLRALIAAGGQIAALGYQDRISPDDADAQAHTLLTRATARRRTDDLISGADATHESYERFTDEDALPPIATGFRDLDDYLGGLNGGDYITIGARPSVGKTSFALSVARNICRSGAAVPLIFSLEMSRQQIVQRFVSMESGVSTHALRARRLTDQQLQIVTDAYIRVGGWTWAISDVPAQRPLDMRARTMRHIAEFPRSVAIVDYLGLMDTDGRSENRTQDVSAISKALKNVARDANIPFLVLSQLSRAVEGRSVHVPLLSDLRDSGSIEQDSDVVAFLYREELYDKETDKRGIAELHIAKHRNGPTGVCVLRFDSATTRFDNLTYRTDA